MKKKMALRVMAFALSAAAVAADIPKTVNDGPFKTIGSLDMGWRRIGPGVFGWMRTAAVHPTDPNIIIAGVDMGGLLKSTDGGKSWRMLGESGKIPSGHPGVEQIHTLVFESKNPNVIWCSTGYGAFKSSDCGETWTLKQGGHKCEANSLQPIAIDPDDTNIIYLGEGRSQNFADGWGIAGNIYKSSDGGETWKTLPKPVRRGKDEKLTIGAWTKILIDPSSPFVKGKGRQRIYIAGLSGFFVSDDGGETWTSLEDKLPGGEFDFPYTHKGGRRSPAIDIAFINDGNASPSLLASVRPRFLENGQIIGGIYKSRDGGQTWTPLNKGLENGIKSKLEKKESNYFLLSVSPTNPKRLYAAALNQVYGSSDGGETWKPLSSSGFEYFPKWFGSLPTKDGNYQKFLDGGIWGSSSITIAPSNPDMVIVTDVRDIKLTRDGGRTWDEPLFEYGEKFRDPPREFMKNRPPARTTHKSRGTGAQIIVARGIAVDPFDSGTIAVGYDDNGLFISRDGGDWWEWAYDGFQKDESPNLETGNLNDRDNGGAVIYDPRHKNRLYAGGGGRWGNSVNLLRSDDGGLTFKQFEIPFLTETAKARAMKKARVPFTEIRSIALETFRPADETVLYVSSSAGIFKSLDGGLAWEDVSGPLKGLDVWHGTDSSGPLKALDVWHGAFVIRPDKPVLFAGVRSARGAAGLYRSDNGGERWEKVCPETLGGVYVIAICQSKPDIMAVTAIPAGTQGRSPFLWRSEDGGKSWRLTDNHHAGIIGLHPTDPDTMLLTTVAADLNRGVTGCYLTRDAGATWFDANKGLALSIWNPATDFYRSAVFDPNDPSRFYMSDETGVLTGKIPPLK
jgi:photosystem II stability/assembly factor-like uncharacterized protein